MASRDLPRTFSQLTTGWIRHLDNEVTLNRKTPSQIEEEKLEDRPKEVKARNLWPAFASGAGLFSDGYVNNSISTVNTCFSRIYGAAYTNSRAISNVSAIAFVGIVVGQVGFGFVSDHMSRKTGMMTANILLIVFTLLCAVATWGAHGSAEGLFTAFTVFRFFLGVGIGAEYPTSSVIASEFANQLPSGHRNRYFVWFTNSMIDLGFVISSFVPMVLLWIFSPRHLTAVWRLTVGLGVIPPLFLFIIRLKMSESESYKKMRMKNTRKIPVIKIVKFYWFRMTIVSLIWFIYNFSSYSFGLYSGVIYGEIIPNKADGLPDLYKTFGWNVVFNLFYIPGSILGAVAADYFGPRLTLSIGTALQALVGFVMSGCYDSLVQHVGAFVVVYGIFSSLGEFGPGDNIGLLASKTSATSIRGVYYGICAAMGKIGAFCGTYAFPAIMAKYNNSVRVPFYISSALCVLSTVLSLFFLPGVGQDAINKEDQDFIEYLIANGYDPHDIGDDDSLHTDSIENVQEVVDNKEKTAEASSKGSTDKLPVYDAKTQV